MKVTLRQRNQGGKTSLYLDYYHKGKRKAEYLKLYLDPNKKGKHDRELNKKNIFHSTALLKGFIWEISSPPMNTNFVTAFILPFEHYYSPILI